MPVDCKTGLFRCKDLCIKIVLLIFSSYHEPNSEITTLSFPKIWDVFLLRHCLHHCQLVTPSGLNDVDVPTVTVKNCGFLNTVTIPDNNLNKTYVKTILLKL